MHQPAHGKRQYHRSDLGRARGQVALRPFARKRQQRGAQRQPDQQGAIAHRAPDGGAKAQAFQRTGRNGRLHHSGQ